MAKPSPSPDPSRKPSSATGNKPKNVVSQARDGGKKPARPAGRVFWENVKSIAGAVVIYLFIKTLFVEAFRIPSGSMIPTLLVGDWLFVNKLAYGPTIPFTNSHLPGYTNPKHGDVMVFVSPYQADNAPDFTPTLVKRLIGMPGDTLFMRDGLLNVNGVPQRQSFASSNPGGDNNSVAATLRVAAHDRGEEHPLRPAAGAAHARQLGSAHHSGRSVFHDGRQPLLLEGQPLLGRRAAGQHQGTAAVRVLLVRPGARRLRTTHAPDR